MAALGAPTTPPAPSARTLYLSPAVRDLMAGAVAGGANVVSGYPFDTIKVRLQSSPGVYRGVTHCFTNIISTQGARGLFRGLSPPLLGGMLETGVNYAVYTRLRNALQDGRGPGPWYAVPAAAAGAGACLSLILGPTELIKCRMQSASGAVYRNPLHCMRELVRSEGVRGVTRGLGATITREVPGNAIFFVVYEELRRVVPGRSSHGGASAAALRSTGEVLADAGSAVLCGGLAGTVMWASVLPLDVAKTRLQTAAPGSRWDVGALRMLPMMWREGGLRSLYAGLAPTLMRAFPANACQWLAWELAMHNLPVAADP